MLNKEILLYIFGDDKTILMTGSKGDGKTNTGSVLQETLVEDLDYETWTNMHFFRYENISKAIEKGKLAKKSGHIYVEKPPQIHMVKSLSELLLGVVNSGPRRKAFFLDEAGIHADSSHASSRHTRTIKQLNRIIRHFECCFILITQTKGSVPPDLREKDVDYHFKMKKNGSIYKLEIGTKQVIEDEYTGEEKITFPTVKKFKIPLSKYPYDGKFPTGFAIDIDLKKALDRLSELDDSIEIMDKGKGKEIILEMIKEKDGEKKYLTTGKYGKKYGVTSKTVREWIKKGKVEYIQIDSGHFRILDYPPRVV